MSILASENKKILNDIIIIFLFILQFFDLKKNLQFYFYIIIYNYNNIEKKI